MNKCVTHEQARAAIQHVDDHIRLSYNIGVLKNYIEQQSSASALLFVENVAAITGGDLWDAKRRRLEEAARTATLDLFEHMGGATSLVLPLCKNTPSLVLAAGESDRLARMLPSDSAAQADGGKS